MIVCICNAVNDKTVAKCIEEHSCSSIAELQQHLTICDRCKLCQDQVEGMIRDGKVHTVRKDQELRKTSMQVSGNIFFGSPRCS
jgi:bacterioferritin-associated ferredoxin